jgi:HlyD family secretion protein
MSAAAPATPSSTFPPRTAKPSLPDLIAREGRRRRGRRLTLAVSLVVVVGAGALAGWLARPKPAPLAQQYRLAEVTRGPLVREVRATGHLEAMSTVSVGAELSGRVATVEVDFNDRVTAGQVLARFDRAALEAQRAQSEALALGARAALAQARADLEQARRARARADELFARQAQTSMEHEAAVTGLAVSQARVAAAEANVAAQSALAAVARTNLSHAVIRSPIDGVVITRNVDPGQTVASMLQTPVLFTIAADLRKMEVLASVDEADVSEVRQGQPASFTVNAWPGRTWEGTVTEVRNAARVVQDVVTYGVVVAVDNLDLALKPGMTASVRVRTGAIDAADQVPNAALRFTPPGEQQPAHPAVWTLEGDRPVAHRVTVGLSDGERTAIGDGELAPGARVLVDLTKEGRRAHGLEPGK